MESDSQEPPYKAGMYDDQEQYAKAEPLYHRALAVRMETLGPDHPDVATSLNNLAYSYSEQGKYAKAEPMFQRALNPRDSPRSKSS